MTSNIIKALWVAFKENAWKLILFIIFLIVLTVSVEPLQTYLDEKRKFLFLVEEEKKEKFKNIATEFHKSGLERRSEYIKTLLSKSVDWYNKGLVKKEDVFKKNKSDSTSDPINDKINIEIVNENIRYNLSENQITFDIDKLTSESPQGTRIQVDMTFKKEELFGLWGPFKISSIQESNIRPISSPISRNLYGGICKNSDVILRKGYSLQSSRVLDENDESIKIEKNELVIIIDEIDIEGIPREGMLKRGKKGLVIESIEGTIFTVIDIKTDSIQTIKENDLIPIKKWFYIETKNKYKGFIAAEFIDKKN